MTQLVFQSPVHAPNVLPLGLDPGPDLIGLAGKLSAKVLIGLLLALLLQEFMAPI